MTKSNQLNDLNPEVSPEANPDESMSDNDDILEDNMSSGDESEAQVFEQQNFLFLFDKEMNFSTKAQSAAASSSHGGDVDMETDEKALDEKIGLTPDDYKKMQEINRR
mmetsp:Transcript_42043/g.64428  ORF Transcript_42043/g.64428 Transcript_42043/m.64428 type:complete len:108 (-) Transcript_42043:1715-2038(-)